MAKPFLVKAFSAIYKRKSSACSAPQKKTKEKWRIQEHG